MKDVGYLEEGANKSTHYGWHCSASGGIVVHFRKALGIHREHSPRTIPIEADCTPQQSYKHAHELKLAFQLLSRVRLFATPWTAACQASLSITNSGSLLKLMSIELVIPSHPRSSPSPPAFDLSQHQGLFQWLGSSHQVAKVLELQLQHQSFQWIFRIDFF